MKMLKSDRASEEQTLMDAFNRVMPFVPLPEEGVQRTKAKNGKAVIEFLPDKTTLFVQTLEVRPQDLARAAALLHALLTEKLPTWKNRGQWLDACLADAHQETRLMRRNEGLAITLRVTIVGIFLDIENA